MNKVKYKNLEWYVIKENEDGKLLFLAERLRPEIVDKHFKHDKYYDVKFNYDYTNVWWRDSYIRSVLNSSFLNELDIKDLNVMETTVELNAEESITRDYVRLLTKEELKELSLEVRQTNDDYGYWLMSPYNWSSHGIAYVFIVGGSTSTGNLDNDWVNSTNGVRPVIYLKPEVELDDLMKVSEEKTIQENISKLSYQQLGTYQLDNNDILGFIKSLNEQLTKHGRKINEVIDYLNKKEG